MLLDADAYTFYMRGHPEVAQLVEEAEEVMLSAVVVGELLYGFRSGSYFDSNVSRLRGSSTVPVSPSLRWGRIPRTGMARLLLPCGPRDAQFPLPIPTNDTWIAAHTMETGAELVSADAHFEHVDGLAWVRVAAS